MKISMNTGIEQILHQEASAATEALPNDVNHLLPSEANLNSRLAGVFDDQHLDQVLLLLARPGVENPDTLKPEVFHRLFSEMPEGLRREAQAHSSAPETAAALEKAADLIDRDKDLISLLNLYRNLLVKS
jgi:hypothetical protein